MIKLMFVLLLNMQLAINISAKDIIQDYLGSYKNYIDIKGTINDGVYTEKNNLFTFKVPQLIKPGATIRDYPTTVSFIDDLGTLVRIDYRTLNHFRKLGMKDKDIIEYSDKILYKDIYRSNDSMILIYKKIVDNKMFIVFKYPEGSTLSDSKTNKRLDAIRGSVCFISNNIYYTISTQSSKIIGLNEKNYDDVPKILKKLKKYYSDFSVIKSNKT